LTELLYLSDHYLKEFDATIIETPDRKSIVLDRTAIYPKGGGQPSDHATIRLQDGSDTMEFVSLESAKSEGKVIHYLSVEIPSSWSDRMLGKKVRGEIDWELRYKHMRHHTALHILSGFVFHEFNARITGGQIYPDRARLDLSLADLSKERQQFIEDEMNKIVKENREVRAFWLTTEEALQKPELCRLSADLLPKGLDKLRIVEIVGFDAQLDGGTHVARTGEIGTIKISKTENKGKDNKRIEIVLSA
jgi:misacylated tRNA(Ala) deacylase